MITRNYDGAIIGWLDCVARGRHRFNQAGTCMDCSATRPGPEVVIRGGVRRREKK